MDESLGHRIMPGDIARAERRRHCSSAIFRTSLRWCGGRESNFLAMNWLTHVTGAVFVALFLTVECQADYVYVWSFDGSIDQYTAPGTGAIIAYANTFDIGDGQEALGLAVDSQGYLYSGNPSDSTVTRYAAGGANSLFASSDSISGLTFNGSGALFGTVPDYSEIASGPGLMTNFAPNANIDYPTSIAFDSTGNVYVANNGHNYLSGSGFVSHGYWPVANTIEKLSPTGQDLGVFASGLNDPYGLAFDASGNLYVSNIGNNSIVKISATGNKTVFATASNGLSDPEGLAFDSGGHLFVANAGNGTVEELDASGHFLSTFASGLSTPCSIAISTQPLPAVPEPSCEISFVLAAAGIGSGARFRRVSAYN